MTKGRILSLTGFMGCGKSSIGKVLLSAMLGKGIQCRLIDLDDFIEARQRRSISDIFDSEGEHAFRAMELSALSELLSSPGDGYTILSLGGGTLTTPECAELIRQKTVCVYLEATIDELVSNLKDDGGKRPMLKDATDETALRKRIGALMEKRESIYRQTASVSIDITGKTYDSVVVSLMHILDSELDS